MAAVTCLGSYTNLKSKLFSDNVKFMGDLPFAIYFDFETTCGKKPNNFDDKASMYPVLYAFVVAFHQTLN